MPVYRLRRMAMKTTRLLSFSALSMFLFAAGAQAQMPPPNPQLQQLHDALHLAPDQDVAWQAYVRSTAIDPAEMTAQRDAAQRMARLSAPERVDLSIHMMKADLATMERRGEALKDFYASLTPEQKTVFDRETMRPPQGM